MSPASSASSCLALGLFLHGHFEALHEEEKLLATIDVRDAYQVIVGQRKGGQFLGCVHTELLKLGDGVLKTCFVGVGWGGAA
jgi:hypothetical protein